MKTRALFYKLIIVSLLFILICPCTIFAQSNNQNNFLDGTILLKVKEGVDPLEKQSGKVRFNIPDLDKLAVKFRVTKLQKRFKHKPIEKNSGLPDISRIYRLEFPKTQNVHEVAMAFAANPNIEYAEAEPLMRTCETPNDPLYGFQQHLPQIMASEAWEIHHGEDGDEVVIAIVDSGTEWFHPDLVGNTWQNLGEDADGDGATIEFNGSEWELDPDDLNGVDDDGNGYADDLIGWDFYEEELFGDGSNPDPYPNGSSHGTHCAGIAAGRTNNDIGISSISYNVEFMALKVDDSSTYFTYPYDGIIYAAENGADIISNSWGAAIYSQTYQEVIDYAVGLGSIIVCAGGNENNDEKFYPSAYVGCVAVSALNPDDTRAAFSSYGVYMDVAAPGVSILSTVTNGDYEPMDGTSMATPLVAGLFGLLKSYQPDWTNEQLIAQVLGTADNINDINPGYDNKLGSGRINAYNTLGDENAGPQELKLELQEFSFVDENDNGSIEPGETVNISVVLRNYAQCVGDENAVFTLSTNDPELTMTKGSSALSIPVDNLIIGEDVFEFEVSEDANSHLAILTLEVETELEVMFGKKIEIPIIIAPDGFLVWEGSANMPDYSGTFMNDFLDERGYPTIYTNTYPQGFTGFDAVFLSFANAGQILNQGTLFDYRYTHAIQQYLEAGGKLYVDGSPFFAAMLYQNFPNADTLMTLFGVDSITFDTASVGMSGLTGGEGTICEGISFNSSTQQLTWYIDQIYPSEESSVPFIEEEIGNVSVYCEGSNGRNTFFMGYSLAELVDVDPFSSRYNVMVKILEYFGYPEGEDFVVANFSSDKTEGEAGLEVQFTDWSISNSDGEITSWAWDFNEDGTIDSYEKDPVWTFNEGGMTDIMLIAGNEADIDTLIRKDYINVRSGILVYEGFKNENGYSGTFIRDYLESHYYEEVNYTTKFPNGFKGYDAVFLSFGNKGHFRTPLTNPMEGVVYDYCLDGGKIYIEGGDVISSAGILWQVFGLSEVGEGIDNPVSNMEGQPESIMEGLDFSNSNQFAFESIDQFQVSNDFPGAVVAFVENDYGAVASQFNGDQMLGQKTFCMSYALANLEDGDGLNTRDELLKRILNFFDVVADVEENELGKETDLKVFPNPAQNLITIQFKVKQSGNVQFEVFDLSGRRVSSMNKSLDTGTHNIDFNISTFNTGVYYFRLQSGNQSETIKWVKVE